jgi:hypothetical protein
MVGSNLRAFLQNRLSPSGYAKARSLYRKIASRIYSHDLNQLALINNTNKWGHHWYTQYYQAHFESRRFEKLNMMEIGIGGYDRPADGGDSLRMWKYFFPNSIIHGVDIYDKDQHAEKRIKIYRGSQIDEQFLNGIIDKVGQMDIIVDDGSHLNQHVIPTFKILFKHLKMGGIYVVEDTFTSYWPDYGGDRTNLQNPETTMNYFKSVVDEVNSWDYWKPGDAPLAYGNTIVSMHFYHGLIIIHKGDNSKFN